VDTLDLTVLSVLAVLNAQEMDIVTTELVSANLDLLEFHVHYLLVHHLVQEVEVVYQSELKWHVNVTLDLLDMIALKKLVQMVALEMEIVLMVFVHVKMVGEEMIVLLVVLDMVKDVVEMENVLKDNVIVILVGLVMVVI